MKRARRIGNRVQRHNWRQISENLRRDALVTTVKVDTNGCIGVTSLPWDRYWCDTQRQIPQNVEACLNALRTARLRFIQSGFDLHFAAPYCHAYFSLLRQTIDRLGEGQASRKLLWAVLGFESAAVYWSGRATPVAALASNAKHPVYLLAKIREPQTCEDPKFLPITTAFDASKDYEDPVPLFYHYRQFASDTRDGLRVLLYPPVNMENRIEGFKCIHTLGSGLTCKRDTRTSQRSGCIAALAFGPLIERLLGRKDRGGESEIRVADLGGGSGDLTRGVFERVAADYLEVISGRRFSWTMVDVGVHDLRRHTHHRGFFRKLSCLRRERSDYLSWVDGQTPNAGAKNYHVVLLCRLLNNASQFSVGWIDDWYQVRKLSGGRLAYDAWRKGAYLPHVALHTDTFRVQDIFASNAKVPLLNGSTFRQLSLSDYYRGLSILSADPPPRDMDPAAIFFPIRRFSGASLDLAGGESALDKLCLLSEVVIVEDVDLEHRALVRYLAERELGHLAASDATDRSQMHTASLLCICAKERASLLPGRRIW